MATTAPSVSVATVAGAGAVAAPGTNVGTFTPESVAVDHRGFISANWTLIVTAAATEVDDTLDVYVQTLIDGTNWVDVVHFTQVLGNGGALIHFNKISKTEPQATFAATTALASGAIRQCFGTSWRVRYVIVDPGGGAAAFSFEVLCTFI